MYNLVDYPVNEKGACFKPTRVWRGVARRLRRFTWAKRWAPPDRANAQCWTLAHGPSALGPCRYKLVGARTP